MSDAGGVVGPVSDQNRVHIFDTALRDGEQSPGISLNTQEKVEIAQQLARLSVDVIERSPDAMFRWMVTVGGRTRGALSLVAVLRQVREALDPGYAASRVRIAVASLVHGLLVRRLLLHGRILALRLIATSASPPGGKRRAGRPRKPGPSCTARPD